MKRCLWWSRRDLRLTDNTALAAALNDADQVIPVYILDDKLLNSPRLQGPRIAWMLEALAAFDVDLKRHGSGLILRRGDPVKELLKLVNESRADAVYFNRDYSPYAVKRDQTIRSVLSKQGVIVKDFKDLIIHEADEVLSAGGKVYSVYTPYSKAWKALPKPAVLPQSPHLDRLQTDDTLSSVPLPSPGDFHSAPASQTIFPVGEANALDRLRDFIVETVQQYKNHRNNPALEGTSRLSPYLRWGMISPRVCYWAAREALESTGSPAVRENIQTWVNELIWREFNYQVLEKNPHIVQRNFRPIYDHLKWNNAAFELDAWKAGKTGYPIVDAAMRQLNQTGWMHNRMRMIVASFLCKDLLIDWRIGEAYFMQKLLDGDVANNVGGWQWTAGTGTDAAPYFRIFNPTSQGEKFDPEGHYIRQWVPELQKLPAKYIHNPVSMSSAEQIYYGCVIDRDYPAPIVEHNKQRVLALAMYGVARNEAN